MGVNGLAARLGRALPPGIGPVLETPLPQHRAFLVPGLAATSLSRLFGRDPEPDLAAVDQMLAMHQLPAGSVVIGDDPGGNLLLLEADGGVAFHAFCGWPLAGAPQTVRLAAAWPDFLASLVPDETVGPDDWSIDYGAVNRSAGHPEWGRDPPSGYHWHFDEPRRVMQLVPRDIHWMAPHVSSTL